MDDESSWEPPHTTEQHHESTRDENDEPPLPLPPTMTAELPMPTALEEGGDDDGSVPSMPWRGLRTISRATHEYHPVTASVGDGEDGDVLDANPFNSNNSSSSVIPIAPPIAPASDEQQYQQQDDAVHKWTSPAHRNGVTVDDGSNSFLFTLLSCIILSPCLLAFLAQVVYCYKKRKTDRVERELLEVSTNPRSRMLVLSEIFKNDSRPVTGEDASPKKKRVRVKKHRKKTLAERLQGSGGNSADDDADGDEEAGRRRGGDDWEGDGEEGLDASDKPTEIYISSYDQVKGASCAEEEEDADDNDADEREDDRAADVVVRLGRGSEEDNEPLTVYVSDTYDELPSSGQGTVTKVDSDARDHLAYKESPDNIERALRSNRIDPGLERGRNLDDGGENDANEVSDSVDVAKMDSQGSTAATSVPKIPSLTPRDDENSEDDHANEKLPEEGGESSKSSPTGVAPMSPRSRPDMPSLTIVAASSKSPNYLSPRASRDKADAAADIHGDRTNSPGVPPSSIFAASPPKPNYLSPRASSMDGPEDARSEPTPKLRNFPCLGDGESDGDSKNSPGMLPLTIITSSPTKNYISPPPASMDKIDAAQSQLTPRLRNFPDLSDDDSDGNEIIGKNAAFRANGNVDEDEESIAEISNCGSSVTEVTSNVDGLLEEGAARGLGISASFDDITLPTRRRLSLNGGTVTVASSLFVPYQMDRTNSGDSGSLSSAGLAAPVPMNSRVDSYKSTGSTAGTSVSNVSYYSYEDMSVASEDADMCAICLCPYEEGDIRIFSKRCTHAFHKECILEWLVKSHDECPCCRKSMVTRAEIKETSASLLGTEQLARALAVVEGSEMRQAPPYLRRTRQMLARAREQARARGDRRTGPHGGGGGLESPNAYHAHWLWNARFGQPPASPTSNVITPGSLPPGLSSMPRLNDGGPHSSPRLIAPRPSNNGPDHNRDWLWATRFSNDAPRGDAPAINPSRSSDAIMNPHEINAAVVAPATPAPAATEAMSMHTTAAGSLFSSTLHNHWQQQQQQQQQQRQTHQTNTTRSTLHHSHWQQQQQHLSPQTPTTRPTTLHHSHWQQQRQIPQRTTTRSTSLHHSHWQQQRQSPQRMTMRSTSLHHSHWQQQNTQTAARRGNHPPSPSAIRSHLRQTSTSNSNSTSEDTPLPQVAAPLAS